MSLEKVKWQLLHREGISNFPLPQHRLIFIGCEECDIILHSPGVEKRHAVLSYDGEKHNFYIKDLNSMTGTYINDTRISEQSYYKLNQNDEIRFGYGAYFTLNKETVEPAEEKKGAEISTALDTYEMLEADSLEDLKEDIFNHEDEVQSNKAATVQESGDNLTLSFGRPSHKISPLSSQVIINYSTTTQSPEHKSDDLSSKTNGSMDSSDSSAGTMTLTASQHQQTQQQQPAAMAFTIPFDGLATSKTFTRKKPKLKEDRTKTPLPTDVDRGTRKFRPMHKSSSDDHSSEPEQYYENDPVKQDLDLNHEEATPNLNGQAPLNETTSYLIQKMLDGSSPQAAKWAGKKSPDATAPSRWAVKKPDRNVTPQSAPHTKWNRSKSSEADYPSSQSKWASRKTPDPSSPPPPAKWASSKTPQQEYAPVNWASRKSPEQELRTSPSTPCVARDKDRDDKSETGTYTVDTEQEDPAVEEARNKIDQVFGVPEKVPGSVFIKGDKMSATSPSENILHHSTVQIRQSKHSITTPPAEKTTFDFIPFNDIMTTSAPNLYGNTYRAWKEAPEREPHAQTPPPHPSPRTNRPTSKTESRKNQNGSQKMGRSLSNKEPGDSLSDGSPQSAKHALYGVFPWRRKSWNLSCSDLELDHGKVETSSVLSDLSTSTEPSSHSSHSSRSRSGDVGPQMRLNRAFALRRARLGFESDETASNQNIGVQAVRPLPRGASVSQSNLLRQDGGRFSLRLPKSAVVKINKQTGKPRENKNMVEPFQHRPPGSKSYVPVPVKKTDTPSSSDVEALRMVGQACPKKEVSALDSLVISAIQQLSVKLKNNACQMLERERKRHPESSDTRLMIEEILPQMMDKRPPDFGSEGNLTKDLSVILKNLKRVEQTLDVFAVLSEQHPPPSVLPAPSPPVAADRMTPKSAQRKGFFVVNC